MFAVAVEALFEVKFSDRYGDCLEENTLLVVLK